MIFSFFRKKRQPSVLDAMIQFTYGDSPPSMTKNPHEAIHLAHEVLLAEIFPLNEVEAVGMEIHSGLFPYSTHDLAVATATSLIRKSTGSRRRELKRLQVSARMIIIDWVNEKKVAPLLAQTFEEMLHRALKENLEPPADQNIRKLAEIAVGIIDLQLNLADKTSNDVRHHRWPLGYCFGALDSVAQYYSLNWETDGYAFITEGFARIMPERDAGQSVRRCLELQKDRFFAEGREHGGDDFHQWLTTKGEFKPLMLMNFFTLGKPAPLHETVEFVSEEDCSVCSKMSANERLEFRKLLDKIPVDKPVCNSCLMAFSRNVGFPIGDGPTEH